MKDSLSYKNKAYLITLFAVILSIIISWFGYTVSTKIISVEHHWQEYNQIAIKKSQALSEIQSLLGYGGLIHNFKDYLIRHDESLIPIIEKKFRDTYAAIDKYEQIKNIEIHEHDTTDHLAANVIRSTVDEYSEKFNQLKKLVSEGKSTIDIDNLIKVNDKPALDAIEILTNHSKNFGESHEKYTTQNIAKTVDFLKAGILFIPLILIVAVLMVNFLKKIVQVNETARSAFDSSRQTSTGTTRYPRSSSPTVSTTSSISRRWLACRELCPTRFASWKTSRGSRTSSYLRRTAA